MKISEFWKRLAKLGKEKNWHITDGNKSVIYDRGCIRCGARCPLSAIATSMGFEVGPTDGEFPLKLPKKFENAIIDAADGDDSEFRCKLLKTLGLEEVK